MEAVRAALPARYRALADLGAGLGLRQSECFAPAPGDVEGLVPGNVIYPKPVVHVRRQVKIVGGRLCFDLPKGGKARTVPLPPDQGHR